MNRLAILLMVGIFLIPVIPSEAALVPRPGTGDPRINIVEYDPMEVIELSAVLGYQILIEFGASESIENVAIGDSLGWQVTPNRKANLLFVKPMENVPPTNMTVVTNSRQYAFDLRVQERAPDDQPIIYVLRFQYPDEEIPNEVVEVIEEPMPPQVVNSYYSYEGSTTTLPERIFDDGEATYFQFRDGDEYPAIFVIEDGDGDGEAIVNSHVREGNVVVDRIAKGFVLRRGSEVTRIFNEGYPDMTPGPQSPLPRVVERECVLIFCL
jgi:type IV secretion system protein VirB9